MITFPLKKASKNYISTSYLSVLCNLSRLIRSARKMMPRLPCKAWCSCLPTRNHIHLLLLLQMLRKMDQLSKTVWKSLFYRSEGSFPWRFWWQCHQDLNNTLICFWILHNFTRFSEIFYKFFFFVHIYESLLYHSKNQISRFWRHSCSWISDINKSFFLSVD